ncbi:MAG: ABC transporter ATP-binding protein [Bacilli bacterium]|nr:ABC transporter ATP-binding protein [Bacilli bacterium]
MATTKRSIEHSFKTSLKHELDRYFFGIKNNPKQQAKYDKRKAKFDELVSRGKNPGWQVVPPYIVDLELCRKNCVKITANLIARYERDLVKEANYDPKKHMIKTIDFFKEQASRLVHKVTKRVAKVRALELLKEVGIPEPAIRYRQYPFEFSGGMRQRVVIAIALSANPDILICDEPTTALDVTIQSQILELINKIKKERNLSVIFITHDLGVVANMADRVAVMYAGKIVEYGTADDIFYDPRHPYTWALLSSMPDLDTKEKLDAIPGTPPNMIYPPKGDAFADRNKYALAIDFEQQPPMFEITETHYAATWLLHPNAPEVKKPAIIEERIKRMKKKDEESRHE